MGQTTEKINGARWKGKVDWKEWKCKMEGVVGRRREVEKQHSYRKTKSTYTAHAIALHVVTYASPTHAHLHVHVCTRTSVHVHIHSKHGRKHTITGIRIYRR